MAKAPASSKSAASAPAQAPAGVPPIAVLHGEERSLILDKTSAIRAALESLHGQCDLITFDGNSARVADVLDELRSVGLIATHKLVVVDNADLLMKEREDEAAAEGGASPALAAAPSSSTRTPRAMLESYAQKPEPASTLVLRAGTWRAGKLDKIIADAGGIIVKYMPMDAFEAARWATDRTRTHHGCILTPDAAAELINLSGVSMARLDSDLDKLAVLAAENAESPVPASAVKSGPADKATPRPTITREMVRALVGDSREEQLWDIQIHALSGNPAEAIRQLRRALEVSDHDPVAIGIAYVDLARKLDGAARGLASGENPRSVAGKVKLWGRTGDSILRIAERLSPAAAHELFRHAIETDRKNKSGEGDQIRNLEMLTLHFARLGG